ncbi:MAG: xanthine dehydrogenase family protein molybdopterin-binding subunit [Thermoplasmata archaeon]
MTRSDATTKVSGEATYGVDLEAPGMLWGALVLSPVAHGRLRNIDLAPARLVPGFVAAVTAQDVRALVGVPATQGEVPVFPDSEVEYMYQPIAAVAAETREAAREAARAVVAEIEPLPVALDLDELFPDWPAIEAKESPHVIAHVHARFGDVESAFHDADLTHSETYRTSGVQQVPLEPHACLAEVTPQRWYVHTSTQTPFGVREDVAGKLGLPVDQVIVEGTWVGGAFGAKGAALLEPYALLLSAATHRPVKLVLRYEEEFQLGRSTLPSVVRMDTAVKDGKISGRRVRLLLDGGASLPGRDFATGYAIGFLLGPYRTPTYEIEGYAVRTNKSPFGPHRAPLAPQSTFVLESHLDGLAHRLGVDPIAFRIEHAWREKDETAYGQPVRPFGLVACLEKARAITADWRKNASAGVGVGVSVGFWSTNAGAGGEARLKLTARGLIIEEGEWEIGSGSVIRGISAVAEKVLGLPPEAVHVVPLDTSKAPFDSGVFGSRTVAALGQAVQKAADELLAEVRRRRKGRSPATLEFSHGRVYVRSGHRRLPFDRVLTPAERRTGGIVTEGKHYAPSAKIDLTRVLDGEFYPYTDFTAAVHVSEVTVDRETAAVKVLRYAAIHDVGRLIDPLTAQGQVEGGIAMGLGAALTEETTWDDRGRLLNPNLLDYRIPSLGEIPPLRFVAVEGFRGAGPYGAKGLGEPPIIPVIAAVANAVFDATGARVTETPLSQERVARAMKLL